MDGVFILPRELISVDKDKLDSYQPPIQRQLSKRLLTQRMVLFVECGGEHQDISVGDEPSPILACG
jgi:hypothetical protein